MCGFCAPRACWPDKTIEEEAREIAQETGAQITISEDVAEATLGADFIYTDVWVSMGEPKEKMGRADRASDALQG